MFADVAALLCSRGRGAKRRNWRTHGTLAFLSLSFLATAGPFVVLLSIAKGRPTFGDSGKINYLMNVGTTQFFIPNEPDAKHPIRKLAGLPNAYEYATPDLRHVPTLV